MNCPRLKHFVRLNPEGKLSCCGHMMDAPLFSSLDEMHNSNWHNDLTDKFNNDVWPNECVRCQTTEQLNEGSVRLCTMHRHDELSGYNSDYLIVGGVLDNVCNSACQSCNSELSTLIGNLESGKNAIKIKNVSLFDSLPQDRIVQLDVNGGEPTASPNYKKLLNNLPPNVKYVRVNTNGSRMLPNIRQILDQDLHLTITLSLDGIGNTHDYVRWPIKWESYTRVVDQYKELTSTYSNLHLDFWTTVHALNIGTIDQIIEYANSKEILWFFGILEQPNELNIKMKNSFTVAAKEKLLLTSNEICSKLAEITGVDKNNQESLNSYIQQQDKLRSISINTYLKENHYAKTI